MENREILKQKRDILKIEKRNRGNYWTSIEIAKVKGLVVLDPESFDWSGLSDEFPYKKLFKLRLGGPCRRGARDIEAEEAGAQETKRGQQK